MVGLYVGFAKRPSCCSVGQKVVSFMPSGVSKRFCKKTSYGMPLTTSMMRPAVLMPALEYCHLILQAHTTLKRTLA